MKGLLYRDFLWLSKQKRLLIVLTALIVMYFVMNMETFIIGFLPVMSAMMEAKTISLDLSSQHSKYLFSLPFSREQYVLEKYLMSFGMPIVFAVLTAGACSLLHPENTDMYFLTALTVTAVIILMESALIPLSIKYREKAMHFLMLLGVGLMLIFLFIDDYLPDLTAWNMPFSLSLPALAAIGAAVVIVCAAISFVMSRKLMQKEEI